MKRILKSKSYIISLVLFVLTIVLNYMSSSGLLFKYSQKEISDTYANLLAPAGFTFSIWGLIYIGMLVSYLFPIFVEMRNRDESFYLNKVTPYFILWTLFNIAWTVAWNSDLIVISLVSIILYSVSLVKLLSIIHRNREFAHKYRWMISFPIGLHTGWLIFASFTNVMVLMVKSGFNPFGTFGVILTVVFMVLAIVCVLLLYRRFDNFCVTLPAIWALFGIFFKHRPISDFNNKSEVVMWSAVVFIAAALSIHVLFLRMHREKR